jgi:3-methyladenine DNA glycosylase AlkD
LIANDLLISRIDEKLFNSEDLHIHQDIVKRAITGPKWFQNSETGYRHLVYDVISKQDGKLRHMRAVYIPTIQKISSDLWKEMKSKGSLKFDSILEICNDLLKHNTAEYRVIAFDWCFRMKRHYKPEHFTIFERWVRTHLIDWGSVDDYCTHTMGFFLYKYSKFAPQAKKWALSKNPWIRRAAAVSFIYGLRRGTFIEHIFDVANTLLIDEHKYVQWGYGWMLKEATKHFLNDVFEYVMRNKSVMPRRSLRYAVEKMPDNLKQKALN